MNLNTIPTRTSRRSLAIVLLLSLAFGACADVSEAEIAAVEQELTSPLPSAAGRHDLAFDVSNGDQRSYVLHLPPSYDPARAEEYSLYVVFHGGGQSADAFYNRPGIDELKTIVDTRENEILVFPNSEPGTDVTLTGKWKPVVTATKDDPLFAFELMDHLVAGLNIDETRVFAAGYSNGGRFVHELASREPERFRAVAEIAGYLKTNFEVGPPIAPAGTFLPILMVHGENDPVVPLGGGLFFSTLNESWDRWNDNNDCTLSSYTIYLSGSEYRTTACQYGTFRNFVRQQLVYNHGHSWPVWSDGMSASTTMVQFFDQQL